MKLLPAVEEIVKSESKTKKSRLANKAGLDNKIISGINSCQDINFLYSEEDMNNAVATIGNSCMSNQYKPYSYWFHADKLFCVAVYKNTRALINVAEKKYCSVYGRENTEIKNILACYGVKLDDNTFSNVNTPERIVEYKKVSKITSYYKAGNFTVAIIHNKKGLQAICKKDRKELGRPFFNTVGSFNDVFCFQHNNIDLQKYINKEYNNSVMNYNNRFNLKSEFAHVRIDNANAYKTQDINKNYIGKVFRLKNQSEYKAVILDFEKIKVRESTYIENKTEPLSVPYNDSTKKNQEGNLEIIELPGEPEIIKAETWDI